MKSRLKVLEEECRRQLEKLGDERFRLGAEANPYQQGVIDGQMRSLKLLLALVVNEQLA